MGVPKDLGLEGHGSVCIVFGRGLLVPGPGQGCGRDWGHWTQGSKAKDKECISVNKLGHLIKGIKIKSLEKTYMLVLHIKESEIIDVFWVHA